MNVTVDQTIERIEQLYASVTGTQPPPVNGPGAPIPPERDAGAHVEERLRILLTAMERLAGQAVPPPMWMPRAIVTRDKASLEIAIDLPGVLREQVQILIEGQVVTVMGRRDVAPVSQEERRMEACEVPLGAFARSFQLGVPVAPDDVVAQLASGVLTIHIVTGKRAETSQIPIKS